MRQRAKEKQQQVRDDNEDLLLMRQKAEYVANTYPDIAASAMRANPHGFFDDVLSGLYDKLSRQ